MVNTNNRLNPVSMRGRSWCIVDRKVFDRAIGLLKESLTLGARESFFCSDNLIGWNRNLSFLRSDDFLNELNNGKHSFEEKSIAWRTYSLLYFAQIASKVPGDFLELGCHTGYTAFQILRKINFKLLRKHYYLYDQFNTQNFSEGMAMPAHEDPQMYEGVKEKFKQYRFVSIIKGSVPDSFKKGFPKKIAFAHIDMNHPKPEVASLEKVLPRLSKGGVIIFDDYGWWGYSAQKKALDEVVSLHDHEILEMPTGQGLLIKT